MVRVRIAPSPTGYPHIGTIYQALFNWAFAHKYGGKFVVRIEDTDRERFVADAEAKLYNALSWFGLDEDESPRKGGEVGPYKQSERIEMYQKYAQELLDKGHAYFAYLPKLQAGKKKDYTKESAPQQPHEIETSEVAPQNIEEMLRRGDWVVRMKVPKDTQITIKDEIRGEITFDSKQVSEQVLLKSDGFPTYHLAAVVDDHLMGITHVVRAEEWLSSTPKHWLLYEYFGWEKPLFFHTSLLRNPDKSKLSKRHGHTDVAWYHEEGYLPEAILNFLALMGWSHPEEKEYFSLEEFIKHFELKDMKAVGPIFDLTKLTWMNQQYIQDLADDALKARLKDFYPDLEDDALLGKLLPLLKTRMNTLKDFAVLTEHFFHTPTETIKTPEEVAIAKDLRDRFSQVSDWNKEQILEVCREIMQSHKIKMPMLYTIFTSKPKGLPLPESLEILGKEETLRRLAVSS